MTRAEASKRYERTAKDHAEHNKAVSALRFAQRDTVRSLVAMRQGDYTKASEYARLAGECLDEAEQALGVSRVTPADPDGVAKGQSRLAAAAVGGFFALFIIALIYGLVCWLKGA